MTTEQAASLEKKSQRLKILEYLLGGGELTALKALEMFGCLRLAARIADIRAMGYEIERSWRETNGGARVAVYKMSMEEFCK